MSIISESYGRPPIVLCDVDGVLADFIGHVCAHLACHGFCRMPSTITQDGLARVLGQDELYRAEIAMRRVGFVTTMPWYAEAKTFLASLQRYADVHVLTSPLDDAPAWVPERLAWLRPFVSPHKVIFTSQKHLVRGDVLIEDNASHASAWIAANPEGRAFLLDRPWNRKDTHPRVERARTYSQIVEALFGGGGAL